MRPDPRESMGSPGHQAVLAVTPAEVQYRIVTARRGTPLRAWSATTDLATFFLEVATELLMSLVGKRSPQHKVGVFQVRKVGFERLLFKARVSSPEAAASLRDELLQEIERGVLRWTDKRG